MKLQTNQIQNLIDSLGIDRDSVALLERYCALVLDANMRINLISRGGDQIEEVERQLYLSLAALSRIPCGEQMTWLDVGSGGGFPAIPLAICRPEVQFTLVESIAKKAFFLERTSETLGLANLTILNIRLSPDNKGTIGNRDFDWISLKAVTGWNETLELGVAFLKPGGLLVTYKPTSPSPRETDDFRQRGFQLIDDVDVMDQGSQTHVHIISLRISE